MKLDGKNSKLFNLIMVAALSIALVACVPNQESADTSSKDSAPIEDPNQDISETEIEVEFEESLVVRNLNLDEMVSKVQNGLKSLNTYDSAQLMVVLDDGDEFATTYDVAVDIANNTFSAEVVDFNTVYENMDSVKYTTPKLVEFDGTNLTTTGENDGETVIEKIPLDISTALYYLESNVNTFVRISSSNPELEEEINGEITDLNDKDIVLYKIDLKNPEAVSMLTKLGLIDLAKADVLFDEGSFEFGFDNDGNLVYSKTPYVYGISVVEVVELE